MDLWRVPPVLVIQLKRFQFTECVCGVWCGCVCVCVWSVCVCVCVCACVCGVVWCGVV